MYEEFQIKKKRKPTKQKGQETFRPFKEEGTQKANENMKRNSAVLVIREMK